MEYELIPSFKESLFGLSVKQNQELLEEYAEIGIDAVIKDGVLKDIPIVGTICLIYRTISILVYMCLNARACSQEINGKQGFDDTRH